jgi:hypothetical protein
MADPALHWRQQYLRIVPRMATDQSVTMGMTDGQFHEQATQEISVLQYLGSSLGSIIARLDGRMHALG